MKWLCRRCASSRAVVSLSGWGWGWVDCLLTSSTHYPLSTCLSARSPTVLSSLPAATATLSPTYRTPGPGQRWSLFSYLYYYFIKVSQYKFKFPPPCALAPAAFPLWRRFETPEPEPPIPTHTETDHCTLERGYHLFRTEFPMHLAEEWPSALGFVAPFCSFVCVFAWSSLELHLVRKQTKRGQIE